MVSFIKELQDKLEGPLPGIEAQMKMAPPIRHREMKAPADARLGGVMILIFDIDNKWNTILIRRTEDGKTHSGQISFPGGKMDHTDKDIIHTACRECEEEIGVKMKDIIVLGSLSPIYIPPSNFLVTPTIGFIKNLQNYKASEREVQEIIQLPLELLFNDSIKKEKAVKRSDKIDEVMQTPIYELSEDLVIWGATAMMISELEMIVKR